LFNFQFVLNEAQGKYFMWAAADDEWLPSFIFECMTLLESNSNLGFVVTKYVVVSRFCVAFSLRRIPGLECVTNPDRKRRVLIYSSMPFHTHKDNLVYGLWRRETISNILIELKQSHLGKVIIGASMNEYALSLHRGGFVNKVLFRKRYKFLPPGHVLQPLATLLSTFIRLILRQARGVGQSVAEQHLHDLRLVLQLAGFDERFILQVIDANKHHIRFK
jgi:hypothetical protein